MTLKGLLNLRNDLAEKEDDIPESGLILLVDAREHAVWRALQGLSFWLKKKVLMKRVILPSGWGDFAIVEVIDGTYAIKSLSERKTVEDLRSTMVDLKRKLHFDRLIQNGINHNCVTNIILEITTSDHFFKIPQFKEELVEIKKDSRVSNYNLRCFFNSLNCNKILTSGPMETAVFLLKLISSVLKKKSDIDPESFLVPKCLKKLTERCF